MSIASQTALLVAAVANLTSGLKSTFFPKAGGAVSGRLYTEPETVAFSATPVFDATLSNRFHFGMMTTDVTAASFSGGVNGQPISVRVDAGAGGFAFPLPSNVTLLGGVFDNAAGKINTLELTYNDGTSKWEGFWR